MGNRIASGRSQKTQERSRNWTSFEAFNIILAKETNLIADLCNLGNDFKKLVFSLWMTYLHKNEIAFQENSRFNNLPRLTQLNLKRDYNYIIKEERELKRIKTNPKIKKSKASYSLGSRKISIVYKEELENESNVDNLMNKDSEIDEENNLEDQLEDINTEMIIEEAEAEGEANKEVNERNEQNQQVDNFEKFLNNQNSNAFKELTKQEKREIYLRMYCKNLDELNQDEKDNDDEMNKIITDETLILNLLTNNRERAKQTKRLNKLKEKFHFSKYTRNLIRIGIFEQDKKDKDQFRLKFRDVNHITINKLICLIYLAIRLLNYDIYFYDLIRWIISSDIPYYSITHLLPKDLLFIEHDERIFNRESTPQLFSLRTELTSLINYLEIPNLPVPNIKKLILRILNDLNFPDSLAKYICKVFDYQLQNEPNAKNYFTKFNDRWFIMPNYEITAFGFIIIMLNYLFCLDDYHEALLSEEIKLTRNSESKFIWSEWENHMKLKVEYFKSYIYPFKIKSRNYEFKNYDMLIDYYTKNLTIEKPEIFEAYKRKSKMQKEESVKTIYKMFENKLESSSNDNEMENESDLDKNSFKIKPNYYPFTAYTEFINQHFDLPNQDLLNQNFRNKSINYLFEGNCKRICIDNPRIPLAKTNKQFEEQFNEKLKFLINLSSYYLGTVDLKFSQIIVSIEQSFFNSYFKNVSGNAREKKIYKNKLSKRVDYKSAQDKKDDEERRRVEKLDDLDLQYKVLLI